MPATVAAVVGVPWLDKTQNLEGVIELWNCEELNISITLICPQIKAGIGPFALNFIRINVVRSINLIGSVKKLKTTALIVPEWNSISKRPY